MKKKILLIILAIILTNPAVFAFKHTQADAVTEEVLLELPEQDTVQAVSLEAPALSQEESLKEKLKNVYHLEVDKYDKPNFLLSEIWTKHFDEDSLIDKGEFWAAYSGDWSMIFNEGNTTNHYDLGYINIGYDIALKDNNADARIMLNYNPLSSRNFAQNLFADMYIASNKIPHHRVTLGNTRAPVGMEGGASPFLLPFMARSQISRNFGTVRKLGARINGNYSLLGYDVGLYSSDTYFQEFFPGAEFVGKVDLKPLGKTDGRYGKLILGGSMDAGHRDNNFCVVGAHIQYEYKRFMANFEWAQANGYNGPAGYSTDKHASGFYTTFGYMLTKKLQLLARYDQFDPNRNIDNNNKREYSLGLNYFIKGQGLKLIFNYVFCQNDSAKDSHRLLLGTQILL